MSPAGLVLLALPAAPTTPSTPEPLAITNANVLDVRSGRVLAGLTVVLRDGKITSVGTGPAPSGIRTLNARGRHVVPGLVDAHTHISTFAAARQALESGVTTVRSSGVSNYFDVGFRELVKRGALAGPDTLASGYHLRPRVADEAFTNHPALFELMSGVDTVDELRAMARANLDRGVDWIKVLATERAGTADTDPRKQVYSEAELRAVVEEAAARGIPVQAHAHGEEGAMAAVRAGVRSIEHGTYLSDETLALMKEKGTYLVPTYTTVEDLTQPGGDYDVPALTLRGRHMLPRLQRTVRRAHELGVKLVTGADTSYGPNSLTRIAAEVAAFVDLGLSPAEALAPPPSPRPSCCAARARSARSRPASRRPGGGRGQPAAGRAALQDPLLVVSNGRVVVDRLDFARGR